MLTTVHRDAILNALDGHFCSLIKSITDWRAGTITEADYTGYGTRPGITLGAPTVTSPSGGRQRANTVTVTFPTNTGVAQDVIALGVHTANTGGTLRGIGLLDDDVPFYGTADEAINLITAPAHGLVADQRVFVMAAPGAVIPAGLSENIAYFVIASGLDANNFKLSLTSGGAEIDITAKGTAMFIPYKALSIANNATPEFAIGTLIIQI